MKRKEFEMGSEKMKNEIDLDRINALSNEYLSKMRELMPEQGDGRNPLLFICIDKAFKEGFYTCLQEMKQSK